MFPVPAELIDKFTPEPPEVTREMALQLANMIRADLSVSVTGLTKPGGSEMPEKPVGTMFYAIFYCTSDLSIENRIGSSPSRGSSFQKGDGKPSCCIQQI